MNSAVRTVNRPPIMPSDQEIAAMSKMPAQKDVEMGAPVQQSALSQVASEPPVSADV